MKKRMISRCAAAAVAVLLLSGAADASERQVQKSSAFGCKTQQQYSDIMQMAFDQDEAAFISALQRALANGSCTMFRFGQAVFLVDATWTGLACIRNKGESSAFWTNATTIRNP